MTPEPTPATEERGGREATAPPEEHGPAPTGTLVVIGALLLTITWLWMLVLGVLQGRA